MAEALKTRYLNINGQDYDFGGSSVTVDSSLSATSTNPVQNKVVNSALAGKAGTSVATQSANGLLSASDKKRIDREFVSMVPRGTAISAEGTDLNSDDYLKVGNYYCCLDAQGKTFLNNPSKSAFMMMVFAPISTAYDNESTGTYVYRFRLMFSYNANGIWQQAVSSSSTAGSFYYGAWKKLAYTSDIPTQIAISNVTGLQSALDGKLSAGGTVANATKATQDGDGNNIAQTYLKMTDTGVTYSFTE